MSAVRFFPLSLAGFCALALLAGCATPPTDPDDLAYFQETNDPLEPTNRVFYAVNDALDTVVLKPVAQAYRYAVPARARTGVHNALSNLSSPVLFTADVLQGKPQRAGDAAMRFLINSTFGIGGIFDVAEGWGYPTHDNDSGVTLSSWGAPNGPFLFLPVLGPSSPRDAAGFVADIFVDPFAWTGDAISMLGWTRFGVGAVDSRERVLDPLDQIQKTALDPYATIRSLYRQNRQSHIEEVRNDHAATIPVWFPQPAEPSADPASR